MSPAWAPYDARMPADPLAAAPLSLPALPGPLSLTPFRARHLALPLLGGPPGEADDAVVAAVAAPPGPGPSGLLVQEVTVDGRRVRGVVGLLDLAGPTPALAPADRYRARLLPHEGAIAARAARLADRMADLAVDPAPILLLHEPTSSGQRRLATLIDSAVATAPEQDDTDGLGRAHRRWRIRDPDLVDTLARAVAGGRLLIADGHHRYAAHLGLAARRPPVGDGRGLVMICDATRDAPSLAPIHRVLSSTSLERVLGRLEEAGHRTGQVLPRHRGGTGGSSPRDPDVLLVEDRSRVVAVRIVARADLTVVECVHRALDELAGPEGWTTHVAPDRARRAAGRRPDRVALILPAPTIDEVWSAARQGRLLPAKATSFTPKPPLGLVFRSWRDG